MKFSIEIVDGVVRLEADADSADFGSIVDIVDKLQPKANIQTGLVDTPAHHVTQTIFEDRMRELCEIAGRIPDDSDWPEIVANLRERTLSHLQINKLQSLIGLRPGDSYVPLEEMVSRLEHLAPPHPTVAMLEDRINQIAAALGMPMGPGGHTANSILARIQNLKDHAKHLENIRYALNLPGTTSGDIAKAKAIENLVRAAIVLSNAGPTEATPAADDARTKFFTAVLNYLHAKP